MSAGNKIGFCLDSFGFGKSPRASEEGGEEPAGNWWEAGGATGCIQALQPKGAADYAASLLDLSGNDNDAAEGTAPDWDSSNGWKFNGSDDYLDSGIVPDANYTVVIYILNPGGTGKICGYIYMPGETPKQIYFEWANEVGGGAAFTFEETGSGFTEDLNMPQVLALAGGQPYLNGVSFGSDLGDSLTNPLSIYIGCVNLNESPSDYIDIDVAAFAIYSGTLTAEQVSAVSTAMAAL